MGMKSTRQSTSSSQSLACKRYKLMVLFGHCQRKCFHQGILGLRKFHGPVDMKHLEQLAVFSGPRAAPSIWSYGLMAFKNRQLGIVLRGPVQAGFIGFLGIC